MDVHGGGAKEMNLKDQAISGVKWSGFARGSQQVIQIIVTIVLTRLLAPEDFGLIAMALVFTGLIGVFNDFGTGAAIIQKKELTEDDLSSIFWFNVVVGITAALLTIVFSPLVATFYNKAILAPLLSIMAAGFLFTGISNVQQSLLRKRMEFRKLSLIEITSAASGGVLAVGLAYRGFGAWSLVWQGLFTTMTAAFLLWVMSRWRPGFKFKVGSIRAIMSYSLNLLGSGMVNYFSRNVDYLLIGKFLGAEPLGYYTLAYRLMLYPLQNISQVTSRTLFPAFSLIQHNDEIFRDAYLKSTKYIAFVTFPMMLGLFTIADEFVLTLFGPNWEPTIFLLKVLCFVGMMQSIGGTVSQIYMAKGRTDWMFRWGIVATSAVTFAVAIGLFWGIKGVAISYAIVTTAFTYPHFLIPFKLIDLKLKTFVFNFKYELFSSLIMFFILLTSVSIQRSYFVNPEIILFTNSLLGGFAYLMSIRLINGEMYKEILGMVGKSS